MTAPRVTVFGGAHMDRRGRIVGATVAGASNPGRWFEETGGGGFNAARGLARLGLPVAMVAPRGGDGEGEMVARAARAAGVEDRAFTFLDRRTPSYTAILDDGGNLVIGIADMELYALFTPRRLRQRALRDLVAASDLVLVDANLPAETLAAALRMAREAGAGTAAIAISPAKAGRLMPGLADLDCLFMNQAEAAAIAGGHSETAEGWAERLSAAGVSSAVVTRGGASAVAFDATGIVSVRPVEVATLADVTGAGDALAAGFLSAMLQGGDLSRCLRTGVACASVTVRSSFAVAPDLSRERLAQELALVPAAEILLSTGRDRFAPKDPP